MWPVSGSPSRKTAGTSAAEFAGNGFHTSLTSHCLAASDSLPPFTWLGEKSPSRKSVDWHTHHVAEPAQPMQCDQFTYRGCNTLSVPNCHATQKKHEGWDTARLPKPTQGKSRGTGPV
ncbi:hypothetical protein T265_13776 [Opisthorchis viverrini]|uniref:Uncharacterized protein n=1 Tax=Opisthorchis viverrini TaxID=6198 RepID=A0A074ZVT6_OPIVI|nr:hypothetical protein T265_13776 [Opisthorchis viverrini]KER27490.1 hypothetical protein T265_13776 [Opisthorchis viverrini]